MSKKPATPLRPFSFAGMVRGPRPYRHGRALSRTLHELRHHAEGTALGPAGHRLRPDRQRHRAVQTASTWTWRSGRAKASADAGGICMEFPCHPIFENCPPSDRRHRPQSFDDDADRDPARLSDRCRGSDHRLRQDHAGRHHGGDGGRHSGHRPVGRADARWLAQWRPRRFGYGHLALAPRAGRGVRLPRTNSSTPRCLRHRRPAIAIPWARPRL